MSVLEIVVWPAKVLETPAEKVTSFDGELREFVKSMHETMQASGGIGLAANQVGALKRVLVIEIPWTGKADTEEDEDGEKKQWWHDKPLTLVNPVITRKEGKTKWQEGCLSFPEIYEFVDRAANIWVKAQDENGKEFEIEASGLLSICLQHEIDHIDGIVFFKRMGRLKAGMVRKKMLRRGSIEQMESV